MLDNPYAVEKLPACVLDLVIPSRVAEIDSNLALAREHLIIMQERIKEMETDRDALLSRAKELNITDDGMWKIIEIPLYSKKKVDVARLKQLAPDRYAQIIMNIKARLQDKIVSEQEKAESFISQADVKSVIRDKAMLAMVIPEPSEVIGYEVNVVKR